MTINILNTLCKRRSTRRYTNDPISDGSLSLILQAGLLAPSSRAFFPDEFIVVRDKAMLEELSRSKTASSGMLKNADAAIVVIGNTERSDVWVEDCSIAMICMSLAATELGIGNCWVQSRCRFARQSEEDTLSSSDFLRPLLGIPENYEVEAILSLGMPADELEAHDLPDVNDRRVHWEKY